MNRVKPIEIGWSTHVFDVDGKYIFKIPRNSAAPLEKDIEVSSVAGKILGEKIPAYAFVSTENGLIAGYRKIDGFHISGKGIGFDGKRFGTSPDDLPGFRGKIASELAGVLTLLHSPESMDVVKGSVPFADGKEWRNRYCSLYEKVSKNLFPLLEEPVKEGIKRSFDSFLENDFNFAFEPAFIHGDFGGWNILFERESMNISGILDWSSAMIGDPALDFSEILFDFGEEIFSKACNLYGHHLDSGFRERAMFYKSLEGIHDMLFGLESNVENFLQSGMKMLNHDFA